VESVDRTMESGNWTVAVDSGNRTVDLGNRTLE
jgi:hypothetical protein